MRSGSRVVTLLISFFLVFSALNAAQTATTSLHGTVTDPRGAVLQGAVVTLNNPATGYSRTTKSGTDGVYQFLEVPPTTYTLTVSVSGFATLKQDKVTLQVSQPATLDVAMQVKGTTEVVEVSGEAPLVNTTDASQGNAFNTTQLINLPAEGRDPVAILSLQPGVTYIGQNVNQAGDSRGGSVAGARSDQTNVTLDGLDNNDQLSGNAFQGALRAPLDSIQEFRVTTSNSNADAGRSSGAQVSLVTKSGTNSFHGSLYEYNRSNLGQANDWFNEQAELKSGLPNRPGPLVRNTFGASIGGPIKKDRAFFFALYDGQRTNEAVQTTREVPSDLLRAGVVQFPCSTTDPNCVAGASNANFSIASDPRVSASQLLVTMTPAGLANLDPNCAGNGTCPWGGGADPNATAIFQKYPSPNSDALGDGFDFRAFTFAAPAPAKLDTYILKLDYKLTSSGNHSIFLKGHLQNFHNKTAPQFPGQPANDFITNNSKGIFAGYTALFSSTLVNNLRYGFIRQGIGDSGLSATDYNVFRGLDNVQGLTNTVLTNVPVHNLVDDVSWTKGRHTFQFGGNLRIIGNNRSGNAQNISTAVTNVFWLGPAGIANKGTSLDPAAFGYPAVDGSFGESYDFATAALAGLLTETNKTYNQDKNGHFFAPGEMITRNFKSTEGEMYAQDSWRVTPNLVLTGGLRYSLLQPPYEIHGNQVAPNVSLNSWFKKRDQSMLAGNAYNSQNGGLVSMAPSGQANGKQPYWGWDYKDLAPRFAFAYSPHASSGFLHTLFGSAGKSSIRGGYGLYYDHFGEGIVNSFDKNGSFGLTTQLVNPAGSQNVDCTPRFTSLITLPPGPVDSSGNPITFCGQQVVGPPPPALPGTVTPPTLFDPGSFAIYWGLDDKLKTPYSHVFDFSITRELSRNFVFEASYVGRLGRRLLQEEDLAMPLDIVDPSSKMDYFAAATAFTKAANAGTPISQMAPIPFWENLFPQAAGSASSQLFGCSSLPTGSLGANVTATQAMYGTFGCFPGNETTALFIADLFCFPACAQLAGQPTGQPFNFFDDQWSSLYAWRSIGNSSYHGMQLTLRHAMAHGLQFDFNYTFSKSIDIGSNAERINEFEGFGFGSQIINSWSPNQLRSVSDFDTKHQINANWVYEVPFGRGRHWGSGMGRIGDALIGGWGLSGIIHWTSGLPFSMGSGSGWPTNWQLQGEAIRTGSTGKIGVFRDSSGNPNMFQNTTQAVGAFRFPYPGESGQRNELRGPGYFEIDTGLAKVWKITEQQHARFAWEVFNVTNSVRFDAAQSANQFALTFGNFGAYSNTLSKPRVMQFSLRYEF